jgi:hypothetical protein
MDETLDTTEMMTPLILNELMKRKKQGRLPPELQQRVDRLWTETLEVYRRTLAEAGGENAPGAEDKANGQAHAFLIRSTVVTDDEMGHWVQKLDGRRVVVILDSCHSGGLNPTGGPADPTRARGARGRPGGFDFLRSEFARLKDLDQPSLTVLSAASEDEASAELGGQANGAFTAALLSLVAQKPAPIDIRQALDFSRTSIAEEIEARNRLRARRNLEPIKVFVPQLFTTDPQPVYLTLPPAPTDVDPAHEED